jgi:cysteine desulfurase / selenocysteine lyase
MDFNQVREQFPALRDKVFLDSACVSIAPLAATDAVRKFLEVAALCPHRSATMNHIAMDDMRAAARGAVARLINATEEEIALVESTSHGLNLVADALPLERGNRILLCDLEFMQVALPWIQKRAAGVEIDMVASRNGAITIEDIAAALTPQTKVVSISSVQWSNGFRCDLPALSALCRARGVWLVVDAIQQLGALPIDVQQSPVDFLACGGHKWLTSPFGAGFLYIRKDALPRLRPPLTGYLSLETPEGGWGNYFQTPSITPLHDHRIVEDARRYEIGGTANYPGAIALAASVSFINDLGAARIAQQIYALTDHLIAGLQSLDLEIVTPLARENRSGIVTFSLGSVARNLAAMERLLENRVLVSVRYTSQVGGVRVSCHYFNNVQDIDRILNLLAAFLKTG